jgi:predicted Zn finger-like uncharacterized protein
MTESFVTQCPHCRTSFKVSHNQLSVARGAVRCGACKQVFNAARQLLEQSAALPSVSGGGAASAPAAELAANPAPWATATPDLDNLDLDDELARLERRPAKPSASHEAPSLSAQRDQAEDWLDEPFGEHHYDEPDQPLLPEETGAVRKEPRVSKAGASLDDDLQDEPLPLRALPADAGVARAPWAATPLRAHVEDNARQSSPSDRGSEPAPTLHSTRSEPELREEHLLVLQDDPLQLQWEKPQSSMGKRLLWTALTLVAGLTLLAQYVVFHFDELARQDSYRPWFVSLCPTLGCTVPSRVDIQLIRSSNLVVRSHPTFAGALVVDAIIYNRAPFGQPFPLLELRFADLNNKLIASRRFKPSEYLSGDLAGQNEMPPQVPIHIALDILDPGKRAVNYSLSFHSPE